MLLLKTWANIALIKTDDRPVNHTVCLSIQKQKEQCKPSCDLICTAYLYSAEALAKVKDQNMSDAFRDLFLPNGQPPLPGLFTRRVDLATILDAVAANGIADFYSGNLTQEMAAAVRTHGIFFIFFQRNL